MSVVLPEDLLALGFAGDTDNASAARRGGDSRTETNARARGFLVSSALASKI